MPSLAVPVITARRGLTPPGSKTCLARNEKTPGDRRRAFLFGEELVPRLIGKTAGLEHQAHYRSDKPA